MGKPRQLSKRVLRARAAEREAVTARNLAGAAREQAQRDAPETRLQLFGAFARGSS